MKQQIISGLKKKLLLVELPEGSNNLKVFHDIGRPYISYFVKVDTGRLYLEEDVQLFDKLTDITEDQFAEWVDVDNEYGLPIYQNYITTSMPYYDEQISAKESFF